MFVTKFLLNLATWFKSKKKEKKKVVIIDSHDKKTKRYWCR